FEDLLDRIGRAKYYHLDPKALRRPSPVTGEMTETGEGFATFLDDINRTDRTIFRELEEYFYKRFRHYQTIVIDKTVSQVLSGNQLVPKDCFVLKFKTIHDELLPAEGVSDGVILALALTALCYAPTPVGTLLIEEPENAVHFASLKETVQTLRDMAARKGTQVFATTHSPYLLDLAELNEVWVFNKDQEGAVHAKNLAEFPEAQDMRKHFMTGEIWTGLDEQEVHTGSTEEK
ncbi:MAG TPA: ATP-binding protein, partial [Phycisphaerae bacterium]|nr:ATP-binding protein [Phycisphaerae bacterium]